MKLKDIIQAFIEYIIYIHHADSTQALAEMSTDSSTSLIFLPLDNSTFPPL